MREYQRLIAMEVVDHIFVRRKNDVLQRNHIVVVISAHKNLHIGGNFSDSSYALCGDLVPSAAILFFGHFVQKFERDGILERSESSRKLLPQFYEALLVFWILEKTRLMLAGVEREAVCFVQVENHVQLVFSSPVNCFLNV